MESKPMITLTIDGKEVTVPDGMMVLEAAQQSDIRIPTLCHHPDLSPYGGCRLCLVEVDEAPRLVASCVTPVRNGMKVVTTNDRIIEARRIVLEFLLSEKPHYCMFCAQSGDCELQNLLYEYQVDHLTIPSLDQTFPVDTSHQDMVWDHNRCILCGRCVRACREISGNVVLDYQGRGSQTMVGVDLADGLGQSTCVSCGACLEFCPTGAIFNRHRTHYAVKGKSKDWRLVESVCAECGLLCPTSNHVWGNNLIKIESRSKRTEPDRGQLCRKGRFDPPKIANHRLWGPLFRVERGEWQTVELKEALDRTAGILTDTARRYGDDMVWGLVSPGCSNEEIDSFKAMFEASFPAGRLSSLHGRHDRHWVAAVDGLHIKEAAWDDILSADFILEIGADPTAGHPIINSLTKRAVFEKHAAVAVIGPVNPLGDWATFHVPVKGPRLAELLGFLLDKYNRVDDRVRLETTDQENGAALEALIEQYRQSQRAVFILGPMLTGLPETVALERAIALARVDRPGSMAKTGLIVLRTGGNSAGARDILPAEPVRSDGNGRFRVGFILMSEGDAPEADLQQDLGHLDFLAVITPEKDGPLAQMADVLIPKPTRMETDGTYTSLDSTRKVFKARVLEPPDHIPPAVNIVSAIRERIELTPTDVKRPARPRNGG